MYENAYSTFKINDILPLQKLFRITELRTVPFETVFEKVLIQCFGFSEEELYEKKIFIQ